MSDSKIRATTGLGISLLLESNKFDWCNNILLKATRILKTTLCYCEMKWITVTLMKRTFKQNINWLAKILIMRTRFVVVVVAHIHPPVTGQLQTLNIERSTHFSLQWLLRSWWNPHLLKSFQWSNVSVDFFELLPTEFASFSKPPSRDNYRKAS